MTAPDPNARSDDLLSPFPWRPSRAFLDRLLLVLLLLGLFWLKLRYAAIEPIYGPDASYYHDIAVHVRDGDGLVTDVSLFNAGWREFPHPTAVYPLWPLLLGLVGRVVPLDLAAVWLPTLFYFAAIVLAYRLARRLYPDPLFPETWPVIHAGHAAAAVVALTSAMFFHTSKPFTEGLAYFLLLLTLTRAEALFRAPKPWRGLEVGVLLGLVVLARSQLVLAALAVAGALAWAVLRHGWRRWLPPALACAAGLAVVLGAQLAHLATFTEPRLAYILRFDLARERSALTPLKIMVDPPGLFAWLVDRARGIPIAFGGGKLSYFHCFGLWSATLLLSIPFLALDAVRAFKARRLGLWSWLHDPANLFKLAFALLAIGGVLSLHTIHKALFTPWNFGTRHALTAGFAMFAMLLYLARRPVLGRVLALFVFVGATYFGFWRIDNGIREAPADAADWGAARNAAIVAWLEEQAEAEPGLVVAAPDIEIQKLARYTDGVGFHWFFWATTWAELDYLFDSLGARYLLLRDGTGEKFRLSRDPDRFAATFTKVAARSGYSVFRRREPGDPPAELPRNTCAKDQEEADYGN